MLARAHPAAPFIVYIHMSISTASELLHAALLVIAALHTLTSIYLNFSKFCLILRMWKGPTICSEDDFIKNDTIRKSELAL